MIFMGIRLICNLKTESKDLQYLLLALNMIRTISRSVLSSDPTKNIYIHTHRVNMEVEI